MQQFLVCATITMVSTQAELVVERPVGTDIEKIRREDEADYAWRGGR